MAEEGRTPSWGASLSWQSLNVLLQVVLQLVYIRILAGLLTQEDFGIMAIALIVVGVVALRPTMELYVGYGMLCLFPLSIGFIAALEAMGLD